MENHYREQAAACAQAAAATTLAQVRDRFERAEAAWLAMADRAARTANLREANAARALLAESM